MGRLLPLKELQSSLPVTSNWSEFLCPYPGPSSCYVAFILKYNLWRSVSLKEGECEYWGIINVLHQIILELHR